MIEQIIKFSIRNKLIIGLFTLALFAGGIWSMQKVPLDAVPDITNNQVQVITQAPNLGTEDIEQFVTYPVELAMANLPGVIEIRSVSRFGLSVVTVVFEDDMGTYLPRQLVSEKLSVVREEIPQDFGAPHMGPISTGLGEIYQYTLEVDSAYQGEYSAQDLRTIQDWIVRRQMAMLQGVVEVNAFGGSVKQYEVAVNPNQLKSMGLTISDVYTALQRNNQNTGGAYIEKDHYANFIRGVGMVSSLEELRKITIVNQNGLPVTIGDVAEVRFGEAVRYGAFTKDGKGEAVGGMVLMLKGANSNDVIERVKERVVEIQKSLPEGVYIEPFHDRSELIAKTTETVGENLMLGALIVIFVLVFLLGNIRGGIIVATTIPLSLLIAFILMYVFDVWANLMSLGAIDFGIIVDGAVIIVEGTVFYLSQKVLKGKELTPELRDQVTEKSSSKMMKSAFFGQLIVLIVFIPILALEGVEGKMFRPMALTFMFAMIGVIILCLTYVPMMSAWLLRVKKNDKKSLGDRLVERLEEFYESGIKGALKRSVLILSSAVLLLALAVFLFTRMGGEFIPQLDEGDLAFHVILKPGSGLKETVESSARVEAILLEEFPEVEHAMTRIGVADVPTDPMPMDVGDCIVRLKPKDEWTSAETKEELIEKMKAAISVVPGVNFEFTQPIEMRFNELLTGVREDVAIKLFGEDLDILANKAEEIASLIADIPGIGDMKVEATSGLPQMIVRYNRHKLAQYGLHVDELNAIVQSAFGGGKAGVIFEGEKRFDLVVRLNADYRGNIEDLRQIFIEVPNGSQIPLKEVARIEYESGPMQISRDNTNRRTYVGINVRGRDVRSLVEEIQDRLDAELVLPPGYYIRYGGAFENFERALAKLKLLVPIALGLIFVLIFFALKTLKQSFMIYMAIPLAAIGGVISLWLRDMPFSISAGVGFIVLFGVAVLNGLVLINSWNELKEEGVGLHDRIALGAKRRLRPILLTALTDILGFLPMAVSTSAGAEVQRPLATVVIGGMISATLLTLFVLPILYRWLETRTSRVRLNPVAGLIVFLFMSTSAFSQQVEQKIELSEAVERAREVYPQLKAASLEIDKQDVLKKTAWNLGNTTVFTAGEELGNGGGVYTIVGVQQQNIDLLGVTPRKKLQKERVALAGAALSLSKLELEYQVKQSFGALYAARKKYDLFYSLDSIFTDFERAARIRYETEETSKLTYLAAHNQQKQVAIQKEQAYRDYRIAMSQFNLWMVSDTLFVPNEDLATEWNEPLEVQTDSILQHPMLEVADRQVDVADQAIRVAKAGYYPQFNVQYGAQELDGESGFYQYQAGIQIPLFFVNTKGQVQSAKISREIADQNRYQTQLEVQNQYTRVRENYLKWSTSWNYYRDEVLELAREQMEGATLAYAEGDISYVAFLQNVKDAMQLELNAWSAFSQYLDSRFQMEYYLNQTQD